MPVSGLAETGFFNIGAYSGAYLYANHHQASEMIKNYLK